MNIKEKLLYCLTPVVFIGLFFCAILPVGAQDSSSVWEISKNGNTMFLGGSVHILRAEDFPLPEQFDYAFEQSSMLVLETDVDKISDPAIMQYLMTQMILPDGKTLKTILSPETYSALKAKCEEAGLPIEFVSRLKPAITMLMLTMTEIEKEGFMQEGVDTYYQKKAKDVNKPLYSLETIETQVEALLTIGEGNEDEFVKYSLEGLENSTMNVAAIVSDWREGNSESEESELMELKEDSPEIYNALMLNRNNAWMPQLEEFLTTSPIEFVIVGLAHLHGPDGLLIQLKNSGCTIKQVTKTQLEK